MKRSKRIKGAFVLLLLFLCSLPIYVQAQEPEEDQLHAGSAVVMEAESGRILYEKNGNEKRAMASTTKIMTLLVALEYGDFEAPVRVSERAAGQPKVNMNMKAGETFRLKDLLYAMMLVSYNDAAMAVAEAVGGSCEEFCYLMNLKAKELGACQTHFSTPNGLDAEDHYSTAVDMALIARAALQDPEAMEIMQTISYTIQQDEVNSRSVSLQNKNPLLSSYTAAIGGKTGFTSKAGLCLVGMAEKDGVQLISVVLGSGWPPHSNYRVSDTLKLFQYGYADFSRRSIDMAALDEHLSVEVSGGFQTAVGTKLEGELSYYMKAEEEITVFYDLPYVVKAPVEKGQVLGEAAICVEGKAIGYVPVIAQNAVEQKSFGRILWNVCKSIWPHADADPDENARSGLQQVWSK